MLRDEAANEAREVRLAVEGYTTSRRREADEQIAKKVEDTERRAREILAEAEQRGRNFELQLQQRNEQLEREVRDLEARRERVVRGLQEVAGYIGQAIRQQPPVRPVADPAPLPEAESELTQALEVRESRSRRRLVR